MEIFGLSITRKGTAPRDGALTPVAGGAGHASNGMPWLVREPWTGAWQRNEVLSVPSVLANPTIFACLTLIANDIGKLRPMLVEEDDDGAGVWEETTNSAYTPVLRKPNRYQNHIQFKQSWMISKLSRGNTYVLKERDQVGNVRALYVLDPCFVWPLVAPDGSVFYRLSPNRLAALNFGVAPVTWEQDPEGSYVVPASEIIHDRMNCLFHQLVGLSPLFAAAMPAVAGLAIGNNAQKFWGNAARPSGVLTAPAAISKETAERLATYWSDNFTGDKSGRVAVLGDGLKFEAMTMTALDAQLVQQLNWSAETICTVFHVPAFKVGVGGMPTHQNAEVLNQIYYTDCLQELIESWELCVDEGLALANDLGIELDIKDLLRMDSTTRFKTYSDAITGGWMAPNEARKAENMPPVDGGDTPYMQQQNWPLAQLADRPTPSATTPTTPPAAGTPPATDDPSAEPTQDDQGSGAESDAPAKAALAALVARVAELEAREAERTTMVDAALDGALRTELHLSECRALACQALSNAAIPGPAGKDGEPGAPGADGRDGVDGKDGRDGVDGARGADGINGKDGAPGEPGAPGLPAQLVTLEVNPGDDPRQLVFTMSDAQTVVSRTITLPTPVYQGVFHRGITYGYGDMVTYDGGVWFCHAPKSDNVPGHPGSGWQLAVKRGAIGPKGESHG